MIPDCGGLIGRYLLLVSYKTTGLTYKEAVYWQKLTKIMAWIGNSIHEFLWDVITHQCPIFNGGLAKPPLKLGHGWVFTSYNIVSMYLLLYALISMLV